MGSGGAGKRKKRDHKSRLGEPGVLLLGILFLSEARAGANLVRNSGFEELNPGVLNTTPYNSIWGGLVNDWFGFSTDLYGTGASNLLQPISPHSGARYGGAIGLTLIANDWSGGGYREFLHGRLREPLRPGVFYRVSFYASGTHLYSSAIPLTGIGLGFSNSLPVSTTAINLFGPQTPVTVAAASSGVLPVSVWTRVQNDQYQAHGGESYLSLGWMNFDQPVDPSLNAYLPSVNPGPSPGPGQTVGAGAYFFYDDVSVDCDSSAGFAVNGSTGPVVTLACGDTLRLHNSSDTRNVFGDRWLIEDLDPATSPVPLGVLATGFSEHTWALQTSNTDEIPLQSLLPEIAELVSMGRKFKITRQSYCQNATETASHSVTIQNENHPVWIDTVPGNGSLPIYTRTGIDTRYQLEWEGEAPSSISWQFEHENPASTGSMASRMWKEPANYQNRVTVEFPDGCVMKLPATTRVLREVSFIPNTFTPNRDGLNDFFLPQFSDQILLRMTVFDRWGSAVFQQEGLNGPGWDGNLANGMPAPEGVYAYSIEYTWFTDNPGNTSASKQGTITLIR